MNDIKPILQSRPDSRLGAMLRAATAERPSARLPHKVLAGLSAGAAATGTSAIASGALATTQAAAAAPALGVLVAKWIAVGTVGGVVVAAGLSAAIPGAESSAPAPARARAAAPPQVVPQPAVQPPQAAPAVEDRDAETPRNERAAAPAAAAAASSAGLREELRFIDAARAALAAGDHGRALRELGAYERVAATGMLDREARVLRIEALVKSGDLQQARALAEAYSAAFPQDAHARRLRALTSGGARGSIGEMGDMNPAEKKQ